ncbi:hypothetical protein WR25_13703 [Diploscapter pachys]|uniref:C-type lectin domain-containing protein n=1 Tax=Diploscapter pachys TaxID=2018661 RepID=A0A2A2LFF0_9BILA|nr:hypothetical protein WR25_13703 [Diploscapter pachys]
MAGIIFFLFHALFAVVNPCFQTAPGDGATTILPPSTSTELSTDVTDMTETTPAVDFSTSISTLSTSTSTSTSTTTTTTTGCVPYPGIGTCFANSALLACCAAQCPTGWEFVNGKCYQYFDNRATWNAAAAACMALCTSPSTTCHLPRVYSQQQGMELNDYSGGALPWIDIRKVAADPTQEYPRLLEIWIGTVGMARAEAANVKAWSRFRMAILTNLEHSHASAQVMITHKSRPRIHIKKNKI